MFRCRKRAVRRDAGAKRLRLLAEFLRAKSVRREANGQEETSSQDSEIQVQNHQLIMKLPHDLLFKILILLPAESLFMLQFVCKKWFNLINSSVFIRHHSRQSETVLICQKMTSTAPENNLKSYFHFLDLDHGNHHSFVESIVVNLADVITSYDGLVLATVKNQSSLMLMNPLTRKYTSLPLGTLTDFCFESYGIAFCNDSSLYKVVHLCCEKEGDSSCEILSICASTRKWTRIEGPSSELLRNVRQTNPVSIGGSLYWMSGKHESDYFIISINVENEKFITKKLPISSRKHSRIMEIGGSLGFVGYGEDHYLMQGWILMKDGKELEENWVNSFNINLDNVSVVAICSSRNGEKMVFESPRDCLYVYDFDNDEMKEVHSGDYIDPWFERIEKLYIPHRNTLVSWEDHYQVTFPCSS
ncbi:hypothetical protein CDL12_18128 [Handroanthus impetiginosus]|uniref:F-box domain-containing protein n=1 Tax=Handroanthus impetiginosus TaxID=429701 RepID=A0A2G9GVI9_9LAMI|nr:hypothetical protein CDL12_18128 [Handroanthus impetiginosus]